MANIDVELAAIMSAVRGEEVRGSIHDAIDKINKVSEVCITAGTAVTGPTSSSEGFYEDSLYMNIATWDMWKCIGENSWILLGNLMGNGVSRITKTGTSGLIDTYTIEYTKLPSTTFQVVNGADGVDGDDGNKWYRGTAVSGKSSVPATYQTGITYSNPGDNYLNVSEGAIYHCVVGGNESTATWVYDFTMSGGSGAVSRLSDLTDVDITTPADGDVLVYDGNTDQWINGQASSSGGYNPSDPAETDLADGDFFPFYDVSTNTKKKSLWSNVKAKIKSFLDGLYYGIIYPDPAASIPETGQNSLTAAINSQFNAPTNAQTASLYSVSRWSNEKTRRYVLEGAAVDSPIGETGVGEWQDPETLTNPTELQEQEWGWWYISDLDERVTGIDISSSDDIKIDLEFDPGTGEPIVLGGYIIDTSTGYMCIRFGNTISDTENARVGVAITYQRNEYTTIPLHPVTP